MNPVTSDDHASAGAIARIARGAAPLIFACLLLAHDPFGLDPKAWIVACVAVLMVLWWITEALPIGVTALLPAVLFPLLGVAPADQVSSSYMNSTVFLFLGGFCLALAMEHQGLHRRLALAVLRHAGTRPRGLLLGFMCATAFISMWVNNTATCMMMLPIALAVIEGVREQEDLPDEYVRPMGMALMLGVAYASSTGGVGTLVGTAPNMILVGSANKLAQGYAPITFLNWLPIGIPVAVLTTLAGWAIISLWHLRGLRDEHLVPHEMLVRQAAEQGPWRPGERRMVVLFLATALLWVFRGDVVLGSVTIPGWTSLLPWGKNITDGTVALGMAILCFAIPAGGEERGTLLTWHVASRLPWGALLLFGGGFALADGFTTTGLDRALGGALGGLAGVPPFVMVLAVSAATVFLTELTSNTALCVILMPLMASAAKAAGVHPYMLMVPAAVACSLGFMMPVGTPPNAIAFGTGYVPLPVMVRTGFLLNLVAIVVTTVVTYFGVTLIFARG